MTITGIIQHVRFNSGNGFAVLDIEEDNTGAYRCLSGKIFEPKEGFRIIAEGDFTIHPKYGPQFTVTSSKVEIQKDTSSIFQYLSSGLFTGVGVILAHRIVSHFKEETLEIIEHSPERLVEVPGVSTRIANSIQRQHAENFVFQELAGMGLTISQIHKLYEKYQEKAVYILKNTPYQPIYDISGFGFKTVDAIALKSGVKKNAPERVAAGITFVLTDIGNQGHCWCHVDNLAALINDLLPEISDKQIYEVVKKELEKGRIIQEGERVYAKTLYEAEMNAALGISMMLHSSEEMAMMGTLPVTEKMIRRSIQNTELDTGFTLDYCQKQAVMQALQNRLSVITGGPGSGKTTIITAIIDAWMSQYKRYRDPEECVLLCAPTGKAARRMSAVTGVHAETIQRILMRHSKKSEHDWDESDEPKLIILDEASMMDIVLANKLVSYARQKDFLVLIGDIDQLPPIGPGHFFRDCVSSPFIPTTKLEVSHRQKGAIAVNAKRVNDGQGMYALNLNDASFRFVPADKPVVRETVIKEYLDLLNQGYQLSDICCIVPIAKSGRSQTSASDLNLLLREKINPAPAGVAESDKKKLRVGDRVINTENDYDLEVFNGDCGIVDYISEDENVVRVLMDDGKLVDFNRVKATFLSLAYALTVHKTQGSQYRATIVVHSMEHNFMLQRSLLYTAITRATEQVVLVGEERAVNTAVSKIPALERNTALKERIKRLMVK